MSPYYGPDGNNGGTGQQDPYYYNSSQEKKTRGFSLVGWLDGIREAFFNPRGLVQPANLLPGITGDRPMPARRAQMQARERLTMYRQGLARRKMECWKNDLEGQILIKLRENFHPQNFQALSVMTSKWSNPLRRIVSDTAICYHEPARRKFKETKPPPPEKPVAPAPPQLPAGGPPAPGEPPAPPVPAKKPASPPLGTGDPDIDALAEVLDLQGSRTEEAGPLAKLYEAADLDSVMDTVEKLASILPCVWVRPYVSYPDVEDVTLDSGTTEQRGDPATGKLRYIIYTPAFADVVYDPANPGEALAWWYDGTELQIETGNIIPVRHFWTKDQYFKFSYDWRVLFTEPNQLGRLPVAKFDLELVADNLYYNDGQGDDLLEFTLEVNVLRTIQNARYRDGAFKQLVLTGVDAESVPAEQVMGGPSPVFIPEGATAAVLDFEPDLIAMTQTVKERATEVAARWGISGSDYHAEARPESGYAKRMDRDKVIAESKRRRKFLVTGERDLYKLTAQTLELQPIASIPPLDEEAILEIDFAEPSFADEPHKQAQTDALRIELGLDSIVDLLKRDNPDLSERELVLLAHKKSRINDAFTSAPQRDLVKLLAEAAASGGSSPKGGALGIPGQSQLGGQSSGGGGSGEGGGGGAGGAGP